MPFVDSIWGNIATRDSPVIGSGKPSIRDIQIRGVIDSKRAPWERPMGLENQSDS